MRSVCCLSLRMSIWSSVQCFTISSAASFGMMPSRPCTRASAASMSRYFCVRFSSDQTLRIASALKMSPKMLESMIVDGMVSALSEWLRIKTWAARRVSASSLREDAHCSCDHWSIDHFAVDLNGAFARFGCSYNALRPSDIDFAGSDRSMDRVDLPRMDAQLGAEAAGAREAEIGEELGLVADLRRDAGDRRGDPRDARRQGDAARRIEKAAIVSGQVEVEGVVERAECDALHACGAGERVDVDDPLRRL